MSSPSAATNRPSWGNFLLFFALLPMLFNFGSLQMMTLSSQQVQPGGQVKETLVLVNNTLLPGNPTIVQSFMPGALVYDPNNTMLYVADSSANSVFEVNSTTGLIQNQIPVGMSPSQVVYDQSNEYLYVGNNESNSVSVIDTLVDLVIANISVGSPRFLTYDSSNNYVYVANFASTNISLIIGTSFVKNVTISSSPSAMAFDSENNDLYVVFGNSTISILSGATNQIIENLTVNSNADWISYDQFNERLYLSGFPNMTILDGVTNAVIGVIRNLFGVSSIAFDPVNGLLYATISGVIYIVDTRTNGVVGMLGTGGSEIPSESVNEQACYDSTDHNVYVSDDGGGFIDVVNTSTNSFSRMIPLNDEPQSITYDAANQNLYVTSVSAAFYPGQTNKLYAIDGQTSKVMRSSNISTSGPIAYDSNNGYLYIGSFFSSNVTVFDPTTNKTISQIDLGYSQSILLANPSNGYIYAGSGQGAPSIPLGFEGVIWVIKGSKVIGNVSIGSFPSDMAYDSQNKEIYVTNPNGTVSVLNGTMIKGNVFRVGEPLGITFDSSNGYLYVSSRSNKVAVIDPATAVLVANITVGANPTNILFDPSNNFVYVANTGIEGVTNSFPPGNITVINGTSVVNTIKAGQGSSRMSYNPSNGNIYVLNFYSGTISIISSSRTGIDLGYLPFLIPGVIIAIIVLVVLVAALAIRKKKGRRERKLPF